MNARGPQSGPRAIDQDGDRVDSTHPVRRCVAGHSFTGSVHDHARLRIPTVAGEGLERDERSAFVIRVRDRTRAREAR